MTLITFLIPLILVYWFYTLELLIGIAVIIPLLIVFIIVYAYTPKEVILDDRCLVIKRVLGQIVIPYDKIREISFFEKLNWKTIRIFGSGGLFGWFGLFRVPEVGDVWIYARKRKDFVLIKADKNYLGCSTNL